MLTIAQGLKPFKPSKIAAPSSTTLPSTLLSITGHTVCVSGRCSKPRHVINTLIRSSGGIVHKHVNKTTTILVVGIHPSAHKMHQANRHGTIILTEQEFLNIVPAF